MRIANLAGRSTIVTEAGLIDVASASRGAFSASLERCLAHLDQLAQWVRSTSPAVTDPTTPSELLGDARLGPLIERPQQIFAVGLNYRQHAEEMGLALPKEPMVFTKFVSSLCGPNDPLTPPSETTDFEAELVVVIGTSARSVPVERALSLVGGFAVGQDFSERTLQMAGFPAQFSLGKSFKNFAPVGPWLTTPDEVANLEDLRITCEVSGVCYQDASTSDMVFGVAELISYLSQVVELRRGDLLFTGSPHGVGQGQTPPRFLTRGDRVTTSIEGLGTIVNEVL